MMQQQANPFDQFDAPAAPAAGAAPARIYGSPKPVDPIEQARLDLALRGEGRNVAADARAERREDRMANAADLAAKKTQRELDSPLGTEGERTAAFLATRLVNAAQQIQGVTNSAPGAAKPSPLAGLAGVFGETARNYANTPERQQIEAAQREFLDSALTLGTGAAYTPGQLEGYRIAYFPQLGDSEDTIRQKHSSMETMLAAARVKAGAAAPQIDAALASLGGTPAAANSASPERESPGKAVPLIGSQVYATEADQKYAALAQAAFDRGASRQELDALAVKYGYKPYGPDLDSGIAWRQKNGKGVQIAAPETGVQERTAVQDALVQAATSPVGSYATAVGNGFTLGGLDEIVGGTQAFLTGRPVDEAIAEADLQKKLIAEQNPTADVLGNITGAVGGSLLGGAGAARLGLGTGGKWIARGLDAASGAAYGGLENNQDRVGGALEGAAGGVVGGAVGRRLVKGAAGLVGPTGGRTPNLYREGVRPTPGQVRGGIANWMEEMGGSLPIAGAAFRGARQQARDQFERGAFNQSLREIGQELPADVPLGTQPHRFAQKAFDDAYADARASMQMVPDQQFTTEFANLQRNVLGSMETGSVDRFRRVVTDKVGRRMQGGQMNGDEYKAAASDIGKLIRNIRNNPNGDRELAEALEQFSDVLDGAARRSSPAEAVAKLDAADAGYAKLVRIEEAANIAGNNGRFTPSQFERGVRRAAGGRGTRSRAYLRGEALMQDYAAEGKALVDRHPNSGTPERGLAIGALAGNVALSPLAIAAAVPSLAYAPGVRNVTNSVLAPRASPTANAIADYLRSQEALAGKVGRTGALQFVRD